MDLVAHAITSVADTRLFLGYTDSSKDEQIKLMINIATDMIESYTGRRFFQTTYTNQLINGSGEKTLLLPQYPVTTFTSLGKNGAYDNSADWEDLDAEDYFLDEASGILSGVSRFSLGVENYRATYVAGYTAANMPWDLQWACMRLVKVLMNQRDAAGIKSERLGDRQVTYSEESTGEMSSGIPPAIAVTLDKYKRPRG